MDEDSGYWRVLTNERMRRAKLEEVEICNLSVGNEMVLCGFDVHARNLKSTHTISKGKAYQVNDIIQS